MGGTFTDAVWLDGGGTLHVAKVPTTPSRHADGFRAALDALVADAGADLGAVASLAHGTTVATNALVQGRVATVGLLTTAGFRDVLEIGTQRRTHLYDLRRPEPAPLVPRSLRLEVDERVAPDGTVITPLDEEGVLEAAAAFAVAEVEAVAVSFLFAFVTGAHERRARELLASVLGADVPIAISSEVAPEFREYPRTSTTAVNASLLPLMSEYVRTVEAAKDEAGVAAPLTLMQSNGGVADAGRSARSPVSLVASGPAGGVIGARVLGERAGCRDLLTFDMGGTTADVALVVDGEPQMAYAGEAAGHPIALPQIEILSVGAGAGSIARVDEFGALKVGPQSAGADPGPAAYARGGVDATVADAHIVLGTLHPDSFLGGRMTIHPEAAREAVDRNVARPLRLEVEEAALAILRIADAAMVGAMRIVTLARGHDPRRFALVAFGGAGPLHACALAQELDVDTVLVPRYPGAGSAVGLLLTDARCDRQQTWLQRTAEVDRADLRRRLQALGDAAREEVADAASDASIVVEYAVGMRYAGQAYELAVPLDGLEQIEEERALDDGFAAAHAQAYGHALDEETEIVTLRASAIRPIGATAGGGAAAPSGAATGERTRTIHTAEHGPVEFALWRREALTPGGRLAGPVVIEQDDSTTVVPPGWGVRVDAAETIVLERDR